MRAMVYNDQQKYSYMNKTLHVNSGGFIYWRIVIGVVLIEFSLQRRLVCVGPTKGIVPIHVAPPTGWRQMLSIQEKGGDAEDHN